MKPLVVIPARGGSKRLPNKNILPLGGKPLILHTVDFARKHFSDDQICVSSDDPQIIRIVESTGLKVPFLRPSELATDIATTRDVLIHASKYYSEALEYHHDLIVLLQPTSPFRLDNDLKRGLALYQTSSGIDMVVSVHETKSNPYFVLYEENVDGFLEKSKKGTFTRRQDAPKVWEVNGALYIINKESLILKPIHSFDKIKKSITDENCSVDIDTLIDYDYANYLFKFIFPNVSEL